MKISILVYLVGLCVAHSLNQNKAYTTANDYLDIQAVMSDPEEVKWYMDCFVGRRECEPFSASYQANMPEAIPTLCKKCNEPQKRMWKIFITRLYNEYPGEYLAFQQKYDPKNQYMDGFIKAVSDVD
ncbi:unnamed protein product [Leptosia nina]|uniref:Uncharacterized protein n=1 Tax=Leptosia nina TaxID=320188 RepID=A0AAV1JH53_9NEOP